MTAYIGIDWSGASDDRGQRRAIALAVVDEGRLTVYDGRNRGETVYWLAERAAGGPVVAGIDCSFSVPRWVADLHGCNTIDAIWDVVGASGEGWLTSCPPPFFGPGGRRRSLPDELGFRATEHALRDRGYRPKSLFQLAGAGQVGRGSLRAMPWLAWLRAQGAAIWPFDAPGTCTIVEAWPTLLARESPGSAPARSFGSEHRDDAVTIARALAARGAGCPSRVPPRGAADAALEGWIWEPGLSRASS
jgi:hypothetical protein